MSVQWDIVALTVGVVVASIAGGTFFAFSNFVMPALSTLDDSNGVKAMQAINRAAPSRLFVSSLLLGVFAGVPVLVAELDTVGDSRTGLAAAGIALSAVSLAVTLGRNVPKNNHLESFDADSAAAATYRRRYVPTWTVDNTVRGLASLASAALYALALRGR